MADEESDQGGVRARTSPAELRVSERKLQVPWCHLAQMWPVGGPNGPVPRQKVWTN